MPLGMCSVQKCIQITHSRTPSENEATAATRSVRARGTMLLLPQRRPSVICACHSPWKTVQASGPLIYHQLLSLSLSASLLPVNTGPAQSRSHWPGGGVVLDQGPCRGESGSYRFIQLERDLKNSHLNPGIATRYGIG